MLDTDYTHATPTSCPYHTHLILAKLNERLIIIIIKLTNLGRSGGIPPPGNFCILDLLIQSGGISGCLIVRIILHITRLARLFVAY